MDIYLKCHCYATFVDSINENMLQKAAKGRKVAPCDFIQARLSQLNFRRKFWLFFSLIFWKTWLTLARYANCASDIIRNFKFQESVWDGGQVDHTIPLWDNHETCPVECDSFTFHHGNIMVCNTDNLKKSNLCLSSTKALGLSVFSTGILRVRTAKENTTSPEWPKRHPLNSKWTKLFTLHWKEHIQKRIIN